MAGFHPVRFRMMAVTSAHTHARDLLPEILVPTLLLWGDDDASSPMSVAGQLRDAIPGATLVVIPRPATSANLEVPSRFNEAIREFCLSVSTA